MAVLWNQWTNSYTSVAESHLLTSICALRRNGLLSIIWKCNPPGKIKRDFFQGVVVSKLLYGCTTLMLTKFILKRLGGSITRMFWTNSRSNTPRNYILSLKSSYSKTNKVCWKKQEGNHQWRFHVDPVTWTYQYWTTELIIPTTALYGYGI